MARSDQVSLEIPTSQRAGFQRLIDLPPDIHQALKTALETAKPAFSPEAFAEELSQQTPISKEDLTDILGVLFSLRATQEHYGMPIARLAQAGAKAARRIEYVKDDTQETQLERRLEELLSVEGSLGISAKALTILLRQKNTFASARITTDVRPIFSGGEDPRPMAGLVVHNLEIVSHTDKQDHRSYFFALDNSDLKAVQAVIDRALKKEVALKDTIGRAGLSYVAPDED
jgi:hypothetical protein